MFDPTKNYVNKTGVIRFDGHIVRFDQFMYELYQIMYKNGYMNYNSAHRVNKFYEALTNENLIIPLEKNDSFTSELFSTKGMRPVDFRLLDIDQTKAFYNIYGKHIQTVRTQFMQPLSTVSYSDDAMENCYMAMTEEYDKLINITYLIDNESLNKIIHGIDIHDSEYIANKKVKDLTVDELLFAVNKKLDKEKLNGTNNK